MERREQTDKSLRELIDVIHFTEKVSAKIHGKKSEVDIYRTIREEFENSKRYNASILLLTDNGTKLKIAETSLAPRKLRAGEKASGLRVKEHKIDLNKSRIYSQVAKKGETIQINARDLISEWVPPSLAYLVSKITGYEKKGTILTPLERQGKIVGTLAVSSTSLAEYFIPSVKNLGQHISSALELADEQLVRKQAEELLRSVVESSPDGIVTVDAKGGITSCNISATRMLGYSQHEMVGKHFSRIGVVQAEDLPRYVKLFSSALRERITKPLELTFHRKDGTSFLAEIRVGSFKKGDMTIGLEAILRDITDRKKTEEALRESEQRLRNIIDTSPDAIVWTDTTGKITLVNRKGFELTGFGEKDLVGKNFMEVEALTQVSKEKILESFMKRLEGIDTPPYEVDVVAKYGEIIPAELSASAIYEGDRVVGTQSIFRDLRERKKMEEKLKQYSEHLEELVQERTEELVESEKRYSVLVEEASDGVVILQEGKAVFANRKAAETIGYSRDELVGLPFEKVVDEKYLQLATEGYMRIMQGEAVPPIAELDLIAKTGERVPIEASSTLIRYQGRLSNLVIIRDISDRKRIEEERLRLEKLAAIGEMATMVGHDLRNPLQSIENAAYYLNNELPRLPPSTPIPQKALEMLQSIHDSVSYADKIVRDLHDFSATRKPTLHSLTTRNT